MFFKSLQVLRPLSVVRKTLEPFTFVTVASRSIGDAILNKGVTLFLMKTRSFTETFATLKVLQLFEVGAIEDPFLLLVVAVVLCTPFFLEVARRDNSPGQNALRQKVPKRRRKRFVDVLFGAFEVPFCVLQVLFLLR